MCDIWSVGEFTMPLSSVLSPCEPVPTLLNSMSVFSVIKFELFRLVSFYLLGPLC